MAPESWLKISLPAFPVGFTIVVVWLYWGENPLPLLAPALAFWGVVIFFYVFTHWYVPNRGYPLVIMIFGAVLWFGCSITSHNLGKFFASGRYTGVKSLFSNRDFLAAYICCLANAIMGLINFRKYEPQIMAEIKEQRARIQSGGA